MPEHVSISPKLEFTRNTRAAAAHQDIMASPMFIAACEAALLQYQLDITPRDNEPAMLAGVTLRMAGAHGFLNVLLNLGIPNTEGEKHVSLGLVDVEGFWKDNPYPPKPENSNPPIP